MTSLGNGTRLATTFQTQEEGVNSHDSYIDVLKTFITTAITKTHGINFFWEQGTSNDGASIGGNHDDAHMG